MNVLFSSTVTELQLYHKEKQSTKTEAKFGQELLSGAPLPSPCIFTGIMTATHYIDIVDTGGVCLGDYQGAKLTVAMSPLAP